MSGTLEGWTLGENETAAWASTRTVDVTIDADGMSVEVDTKDAGFVTATIPIAVLREVLRRVDAKGEPS